MVCVGVKIIEERIVEAYVGEYASGKSENAVNRALELVRSGRQVNLVDLDLVEPFYTLRPIKQELTNMGLKVIAWETGETMGLGEAGSIIKPEMRWALQRPGDVILDIGYGVEGAKTLNLVEGAAQNPDLKVFAVVNVYRPMTSTINEIISYVSELGLVHGLINNSHLGDETQIKDIEEGARIVTEAAKELRLPVVATAVDIKLKKEFSTGHDCMGNPVRFLTRFMQNTFW
ncbi:MAG: hypothetical protein M0Z31_06730 [Clostridia bacterium]|nr:hypothetical protein [Clostridia bacterium]